MTAREQLQRPDLAHPDPLRELIRGNLSGHPMPTARDGLIVEDLDLILRWKGERYGLDDLGRFRLVEVKQPGADLTTGQWWLFRHLMQPILASSPRFDGFFIVRVNKRHTTTSSQGHPVLAPDTRFVVVGKERHPMTVPDFLSWCDTPHSPFPGLPLMAPQPNRNRAA